MKRQRPVALPWRGGGRGPRGHDRARAAALFSRPRAGRVHGLRVNRGGRTLRYAGAKSWREIHAIRAKAKRSVKRKSDDEMSDGCDKKQKNDKEN